MAKSPWNRTKDKVITVAWATGLTLVTFALMGYSGRYMEANRFRYMQKADMKSEGLLTIETTDDAELVSTEEATTEEIVVDEDNVAMKTVNVVEKRENYNGEELKDNGCYYAIKVNRKKNIVTVYTLDDKGVYSVPVKAMRCSVGPDDVTPVGVYETQIKMEWCGLYGGVWGHYVTQIVGDILFHSVPYETKSRDSLESEEYNALGTTASMGCIRLAAIDAQWIFDHCASGTQVNLFDSDYVGPMGCPSVLATVDLSDERAGWDPTDMKSNNPWLEEGILLGVEDREVQVGDPWNAKAGVYALDKNAKDISDKITVLGTVDTHTAGDYELIYECEAGDTRLSKTITVTVLDNTAPVIAAVPVDYLLSKNSLANASKEIAKHVEAYDNGKRMKASQIKVDTSKIKNKDGSYTVTCYAVDEVGNESETVEITTILDTTSPEINVKPDGYSITIDQAKDQAFMDSLAEAKDDGESVEVHASLPSTVKKGLKYRVVYYAVDKNGNASAKTVKYRIED